MTILKASRREFLVGCSAAIAAMSGSRLSHLVFGSGGNGQQQNVLLYVFLRGGIDGLTLVPPTDGPDRGTYEEARPVLKVPSAGPDAALDTMDFFEAFVTEDYQPANGANYPQDEFGEQLQVIAQLMKLRVGLSVATLDLGGWDTHDNQGVGGGYYSNLVARLAQGLAALYLDLD